VTEPGPEIEWEEGDDEGDGSPINNEHNGGVPTCLADEVDEEWPDE
jgi:hypothetical protein